MPIAPKKFSPVITQAGKNEVTKLPNNMALQITHVGFGTGKYLPTDASVALQSEVVRVPVSAGSSSGGMIQCYCDAMAPKGGSFFAYEIGFYCGSVLFAVFSTTGNALMYIADDAITTGAYSINLVDVPSGSVSVSVDPNAPLASVLVANHEAKQEPHPQYLLSSKAQATYAPKAHSHPVPEPVPAQGLLGLGAGVSAIGIPAVVIPSNKASYTGFVHGSTTIENGIGFQHHISFGAYRTGVTGWGGGAYIALGTNSDTTPTEAYLFELSGKLTHSSGRSYVSNFDVPLTARRASYGYSDSASINNANSEHGFDYNTAGSGLVGSFISFGGLNEFDSANRQSYQCQIQAGYQTGQSIKFRTCNGDNGTWNDWRDIIHSSNIEAYLRSLNVHTATTLNKVSQLTNDAGYLTSAHTSHDDPHPQYLLPSEAQAAYAPKAHSHSVPEPRPVQGLNGLSAGASAIGISPVIIPSGRVSYTGFVHGSTHIENIGYQHHISFGSYRTGVTGWGGGAYIALGTNSDSTPTEAYLFELGGKLTHSSGLAYTSSADMPITVRRPSYALTDSVTINNAVREQGFDYDTSTSGIVGSFISFGSAADYQCQIQAGYLTGQSIKFRTRNGDAGTWNGWRDIIHSSNIEAYLRSLTAPIVVNSPANPYGGSMSAYTARGGYGGGYRMIDDDKQYLIYAENGLFKIAMRTGDSGAYVPKFQIDQTGNASLQSGYIHTTGTLNKVSQLANDAAYLSASPTSIQLSNVDAATAAGSYTAQWAGASSGVQTFNFNGSVGQVQLAFHYLGALQFRNKTDSVAWTPWKDVHTSASLTKLSQLANDIGAGFPAGTRMPFNQPVAPVGWTQDTSDATNNRMLRVVNTAGGNWGGTHSPILNNIVSSHTHGFTTGGQSRNHSHVVNDSGHAHSNGANIFDSPDSFGNGTGNRSYAGGSDTGISLTGISIGIENQDHTHSGTTNGNAGAENWQPRYIDMIICIRN